MDEGLMDEGLMDGKLMYENRNYAFAGAFVDELVRSGLRHLCYCPGSRSSPLTLSFARRPEIRKWQHLDERSAAFFALGLARATGEPVALVCSSGTAAANFLPAVVEAHFNPTPLLVLTADRPPELHGWGALQTIDQTRIYGSHAKWTVDVATPEVTPDLMGYVRALACRAYATAASAPAGAVQVNFPFRDPLGPTPVPGDFPGGLLEGNDERVHGRADGTPFTVAAAKNAGPEPDAVKRVLAAVEGVERGVIVCGPQNDPRMGEAVARLASALGYPVLADVLSQVRCGSHDRSLVLDSYDAFIRDKEIAASLTPDVVLRFGPLPVSKPLTEYLERHRSAKHVLVDDGPDWADQSRLSSLVVSASPIAFCEALSEAVQPNGDSRSAWTSRWLGLDQAARTAMDKAIGEFDGLSETRLFAELAPLLPDGASVFGGSSMPVRDMDSFVPGSEKRLEFASNRGASGIDGVVSTALGMAAGSGRRVVLVIGDISFYHDMNGLLAAKLHEINATIIVVNNDGGGIFSFLPQAEYEEVFEPYFGTPHGLTFRDAAALYGTDYALAGDWPGFRSAVANSFSQPGVSIIEVPVADRSTNVAQHRVVWRQASAGRRALAGG